MKMGEGQCKRREENQQSQLNIFLILVVNASLFATTYFSLLFIAKKLLQTTHAYLLDQKPRRAHNTQVQMQPRWR